ncbi:MAG TPA: MBL fold metallo-hydrolase [Polyangia bacterium]
MALIRESFRVGVLGCNCSIVACPATNQALVVDPGDDAPAIIKALGRLGVNAVRLVHTHAHFDHIMGTGEVAGATGAEIVLHKDDRWLYDNLALQTTTFGLPAVPPAPPPTRELDRDQTLTFGQREAHAIHTPGHTPGSTCFFVEAPGETPIVFAGDTLFRGSIGRTDLWGGSAPQIQTSIRERLFTLPDDTIVVAGHGPDTTIGAEKDGNPFVGLRRRNRV